MFLNEMLPVIVRRSHKLFRFVETKGHICTETRRDVKLLREERDMCILRVRKAVSLLVV